MKVCANDIAKSRKDALESGKKFYLTDKLCAHGHRSLRYARSGQCCGCIGDLVTKRRTAESGKSKMLEIDNAVIDRELKRSISEVWE